MPRCQQVQSYHIIHHCLGLDTCTLDFQRGRTIQCYNPLLQTPTHTHFPFLPDSLCNPLTLQKFPQSSLMSKASAFNSSLHLHRDTQQDILSHICLSPLPICLALYFFPPLPGPTLPPCLCLFFLDPRLSLSLSLWTG